MFRLNAHAHVWLADFDLSVEGLFGRFEVVDFVEESKYSLKQ